MHLRKRPMTLINQLVSSPLFALSIVLLIVIAALLIGVLVVLVKRHKPTTVVLDSTGFTAELDRIMKSTAHAAEISAVLGLTKDLEDNPDALALIQDYPETVRAAAWLHYINRLGSDLQAAQTVLSHAHQQTGPYEPGRFYGDLASAQKARQQHVDIVRAKLDAVIKASGGSHRRPAN